MIDTRVATRIGTRVRGGGATGATSPDDPWLGTSSPVAPQRPAIAIEVLRATGSAAGGASSYELLPHVACTDVVWRMGADAKTAVLRYRFDDAVPGAPRSVEGALSTLSSGPGVIEVGDRLAVRAVRPDGARVPLFDGHPQEFRMVLDGDVEAVEVACVGVEHRCRDRPVGGAIHRDASRPDSADEGAQLATDLVARCNPDGLANATGEGEDFDPDPGGVADRKYPVFLDAGVCRDRKIGRRWTLAMLARYLIFTGNPDAEFVQNPDGVGLDSVLVAREPKAGAAYDPADPATFDARPIVVSDRPLTGRDWPGLLDSLVRDKGFGMAFDLDHDGAGNPETTLRVFHLQLGAVRDVHLPARGSPFDPETCNLGSADAARTLEPLVNEWAVDGAPLRKEHSFILLPGFPSAPADSASPAALDRFLLDRDESEQDAYRLFVFNEAGDGYYAPGSTEKASTVPSLDAVFGEGDYVPRRRPATSELVSVDAGNVPLRPRLAISKDYQADAPGLWDGSSGTWQEVAGGWELAADRLGIRITAHDPNGWNIGRSDDAGAPFPAGVVKVVESIGKPSAANPKFVLRLTAAVDGDRILRATAARTDESLSPTTVRRTVDARDRYRRDTVCAGSELNPDGDDQDQRDDTEAAQAEADALREATENGLFGGTLTIPRFTMHYGIGDRIRGIAGRGLGFRLDGGGIRNAPAYPVVEEVHWRLGDGQATTLKLADEAGHARRSRRGRPR